MAQSLSYCGDTVRRHDPDRFLLSLFAPAGLREDLWALYAFNYEIAKTREVVTDTNLGLIRLQWWRDALGAFFEKGTAIPHPVGAALAAAISRHDLPRDFFDSLIYAREFDLEDRVPATLEGMAKYAEFTAAPLTALSLRVQGVTDQPAAVKISVAYALAGILRAVPVHGRQRRCYLPEDVLATQGLTAEDIYDGTAADGLPVVVEAVVATARAQLAGLGPLPRPLALMKKLVEIHLDQIARAGYNLFSPLMLVPPFLRGLRLLIVSLSFAGRKKP